MMLNESAEFGSMSIVIFDAPIPQIYNWLNQTEKYFRFFFHVSFYSFEWRIFRLFAYA